MREEDRSAQCVSKATACAIINLYPLQRSHYHLLHRVCNSLNFHRADPLYQATMDHLESSLDVLTDFDLRFDRIERSLSKIRQSTPAERSATKRSNKIGK